MQNKGSLGVHVISLCFLDTGLRDILNFVLFFLLEKVDIIEFIVKSVWITMAITWPAALCRLWPYKEMESKSGKRIKRTLPEQKHSCLHLKIASWEMTVSGLTIQLRFLLTG